MQYLGGKSRTYKEICAFLESVRKPNQPFVEPFCGACWITQGMSGDRYAADANESLITMWKAAQSGFEFPEYISRDVYNDYRLEPSSDDPLTAFIGFGYSFGGKWFGGYADVRDPKNHLGNPKKTVKSKSDKLTDVRFSNKKYNDIAVENCLVYCDPPYADTTGYGAIGVFDTLRFWDKSRCLIDSGNTVVVSEYSAPDDFICVWEKKTKTELRTKLGRGDRVEKLFMHKSQLNKSTT